MLCLFNKNRKVCIFILNLKQILKKLTMENSLSLKQKRDKLIKKNYELLLIRQKIKKEYEMLKKENHKINLDNIILMNKLKNSNL